MEEREKKHQMGYTAKPYLASELLENSAFMEKLVQSTVLENYRKLPIEPYIKKEEKRKENENSSNEKPVDVVIIVAVPNEHEGVYQAFQLQKNIPRNTDLLDQYRFGYTRFEQDGLQVVLLIQPGMGMTHSCSLCTRAIVAFRPKLISMVGICAGRTGKAELGDIVIASSVFDYTAGKKYIDRFGPRPQSQPVDSAISEFISTFVLGNHELLGKILDGYNGSKPDHINVHFKPMASGTAVIDDPKVMEGAIAVQDDLTAIDMEAYALATAANILRTKWLVIKSVQDFADGDKTAIESTIRPFAAYSSAKLLQLILKPLAPYIK